MTATTATYRDHPLPDGYELVERRRPSPATLAKRPASYWLDDLVALASTQAGREGAWQALPQRAPYASPGGLLSLNDRGAVDVARHRSRSNAYRLTPAGVRILAEAGRLPR